VAPLCQAYERRLCGPSIQHQPTYPLFIAARGVSASTAAANGDSCGRAATHVSRSRSPTVARRPPAGAKAPSGQLRQRGLPGPACPGQEPVQPVRAGHFACLDGQGQQQTSHRLSDRPSLVTDPASKADVSDTGPQVRTTGPDPVIRQPAAPTPAPAETRAACSRSVLALASTREAFHPSRPVTELIADCSDQSGRGLEGYDADPDNEQR
jgi:hypothetical protein